MIEAYVDIAPFCSFKPIDPEQAASSIAPPLDPNSSCDSLEINQGMSPTEIFRECGDDDNIMDADEELPRVRRANPINDQHIASGDDIDEDAEEGMGSRVISPYPFSHTSKEEIEEREQLTNAFDWSQEAVDSYECSDGHEMKFSIQVDYSRFFELVGTIGDQVMEDCDDFSLSSHEANSLSENLCLASISEDPAAFWEVGVGHIASNRCDSPAQVSHGSADL